MDSKQKEADVAADLCIDGMLLLIANNVAKPGYKVWENGFERSNEF